MSNNLVEVYQALHTQVLLLNLRWSQFRLLFTVSDKRMTTLSNIAPGFFRIIQDVFRDDAFISLSRLTDQGRSSRNYNLTLIYLVELAENSENQELATTARSLLNQLLKRVENIRQWRNKWLAHTDLYHAVSEKPLPNVKVQRGDIDAALHLIKELMQLFAKHLSQTPIDYDQLIVPGDADVLANLLESL